MSLIIANAQQHWISKGRLPLMAGLLLAILALASPLKSHAYGWDWNIPSFTSEITVNPDSSLLVKETRIIDYSRESHHGPIIAIPLKYRDRFNQSYNLRFSLLSVTDDKGNAWNYETYTEGDYMKIKIGEGDVFIDSVANYTIVYTIERAISFQFEDHDELYWNVTGDETEVGIGSAEATVLLPEGVNSATTRAVCYTGAYGAATQDCEYTIENGSVHFTTKSELLPRQGLTVAVSFPKNIVQQAGITEQLKWFLSDNWGYLIPFAVLGFMFYLWRTHGKDPKTNRDTVMPIYKAPEGITPAEAGTLIDENVDMRDISSSIIDLAVRGYIKIVEKKEKGLIFEKKDFEFQKLKNFDGNSELREHEKKLLEAIFGSLEKRDLEDLKNKFYKDLPDIQDGVYKSLIEKGFFPKSPKDVRNTYGVIGGTLIFLPIFFGGLIEFIPISIPIGVSISGVIVLIFAKFMPAKTRKGVEAYYQILGLEEFIRTAERDRIKFQEEENIFEKILPYAMAFGIGEKWAKAFEGLQKTAPDWYQSSDPNYMNNFSTYYFLSRLDGLSNTMQSTFTSAPRSSGSGGAWSGGSGFGGGGFSGGGFGGGGTSSW